MGFLEPRLVEIRRVLNDAGSLYFHVDYREVHYGKVLLESLFGRECFLNEVIWAYDYGARPMRARLVPHTGFPVNRLMCLRRVHPVPD
jgi:site-specific DNA-methyltransferase (adenine-specific)